MEKFSYDFNLTHEVNFQRWKTASDKERSTYKEEPYSEKEAKKIFNSMYKDQSSLGAVWEKK